jgi:BMFP domain-containing protein YqiC
MAYIPKSITKDELQNKLLQEFFDSRYFGDQHWFAARAEIEALNAKIDELEAKLKGKAQKGGPAKAPAEKTE